MVFIFIIATFVFLAIFGTEYIQHLIRFRGGVESFSSGRLDGMRELWDVFLASPFIGQGFGFVDSGSTSAPSNLFYFGLLSEIGIVGFLGAMGFLSYPLLLYFGLLGKNAEKGSEKQYFFLIVFSVSVLLGLFVYLLFEFSVLRVSVYHQLFFLCWSITLLSFENDLPRSKI
jgi:O-antigen ligase